MGRVKEMMIEAENNTVCQCQENPSERSELLRKASLNSDAPLLSIQIVKEWCEENLKLEHSASHERMFVETKRCMEELTEEILKGLSI